jgi:hypothetical protein
VIQEQGRACCLLLWCWQGVHIAEQGTEKVREGGERQCRLSLRRCGVQYHHLPLGREVDQRQQQRRLADAGRSLDEYPAVGLQRRDGELEHCIAAN